MAPDQIAQPALRAWRRMATGSVNVRILRAFMIVGGLTFAVKLAALLKDMLAAAAFGTGDSMDALLIAFLVPSFVINVVAGSFNAALIPVFIHTRERDGHAAAQRLFSGVVIVSLGLLSLVTLLLALGGAYALPLLATGFGPAKLALTRRLFYLLLPAILINGLATIWDAVLNAGERFALTALVAIAVPLGSIAGLLLLGPALGIYALAGGMVAGFAIELALLTIGLRRQGLRIWPRWYGLEPPVRRVIGQYLPMLAGAALISGNGLVDQTMAALLDPGSVAVLTYGNKLVSLVLGVGTMALGTAVLPFFATMVAQADWLRLRRSLRLYSGLILLVTIPCALLGYWLSAPLIGLLYQRGNFSPADTLVVSRVQAMYVLQLPFHTLGILFVRLISALQANHILLWGTLISFALNVVLDYLLIQVLGIAGIALATTLVYVVSCGFLLLMLRLKLRQIAGEAG